MAKADRAGMENGPYPNRLIGTAASGFYRTCFTKEPTLSQAHTKLDSVFMADIRSFLE